MLRTKILMSLLIVINVSGISLGIYFGVFYTPNEEPEEVVLTIQGNDFTVNYTLNDLESMKSAVGYAGYRKSTGTLVGPNLFRGILLEDLIAEAGGLTSGQELEVIAGDLYQISFTKEMLNGQSSAYDNSTGEYLGVRNFRIIVAYEMDGQSLPSSDGVLRIACLADEGEGYLSDSSMWVKDVKILQIVNSASWSVNLFGAINDSIDKDVFEAFMYMDDSSNLLIYQIIEGDRLNTYEGLALWRILALFDDDDPYTFNETAALNGYSIILTNSNNDSLILDSINVSLNDSYMLAAKKNGVFLSSDQAPLILMGTGVPMLQMIGQIDEIELVL